MTNSIADLLHKKSFDKPDEIEIIKRYVQDNFRSECGVDIRQNNIIISVSSAPLAGELRMKLHELRKKIKADKRLVIRIQR
jgi:hypothetical protein